MAKYRLGDIAPVCQGTVADSNQFWLLNLDVVESNTGKILEYVYVDHSQIGASTVSFDKMNVLYSKLRPYLNKVVLPDRAGYATSEMLPLRPNGQVITREYLTYYLRSPHFVKYINGKTSGAKMPRANIADLKSVEIECPSIMEQNRITTQFDLIARVIEKRQKELSTFDNLIKARFVEMFGDLRINKKGWGLRSFDDLTELITDGEHATPKRTSEGIYLLSARNILNHAIQIDDVDYIDQEEYDRIAKRVIPTEGDVLISCSGTVGRCCAVPADLKFQMVRSAALLRFKPEIKPKFAEYMITSDFIQEQINQSKTASSQANLFQGKIAKLKGFVPPIDMQEQFTDFVSQVDKSKARVQKALDETQLLFDSLMQEYFG